MDSSHPSGRASELRGILQYVPRFRDRIFVIALDGEVVASENLSNILLDIAVLRSLSIRTVLVHGIGYQLDRAAQAQSFSPSTTDGTGVTDDRTLSLAIEVASQVTHDLLRGLANVDLRACWSNCVITHPAGILSGVDYQHTGRVERVDSDGLRALLDDGFVPVIPPIGFDGEGRSYRVNSDALAVDLAEALHAAKIVFMFNRDGLLRPEGGIYRELSMAQAEEILKNKQLAETSPTYSKLRQAARATKSGVPRVHLINGMANEALLNEIFSNEGVGTMVHSNEYRQIRRVYKKDVRAIMSLIRQSVAHEELIRRTRLEILERLEDFWVLELDRTIVGCAALHVYEEMRCGELACLYVSTHHENKGHGRKLMAFIEDTARKQGLEKLFALSTQAFAYLEQKGGFVEASIDALPESRRLKYQTSERRSRILVKTLSTGKASN
ncbi:MAG: amino-acid N-acetyltransferase [Verrucomicrobiales bacterium]